MVCLLLIASLFSVSAQQKISVFVSVRPQAGIVKKIGGKFVNVTPLVSSGSCPETYSPTPRQVEALSRSNIFLSLGMPFENIWLKKTSNVNKKISVQNMSEGITLRESESENDGHKHTYGDKDPHIWMSIKNLEKMAENTEAVLSKISPANHEYFKKNLKTFLEEAKKTDQTVSEKIKSKNTKYMFVFHPSFGYFTDEYGIEQVPIEAEGKEPGAKQMAKIVKMLKDNHAKTILIQPEFSKKVAEAIAKQSGTEIVNVNVFSEDVFKNIEELADKWK